MRRPRLSIAPPRDSVAMRSAERSPPACWGSPRYALPPRLAHYCHVFRRGPSQLRDGRAESRDICRMEPASKITAEASSPAIARLVPFGARQTVKTVDTVYVGSNPTPATSFPKYCWENSRLTSGWRTGTQRFAGPLAWVRGRAQPHRHVEDHFDCLTHLTINKCGILAVLIATGDDRRWQAKPTAMPECHRRAV